MGVKGDEMVRGSGADRDGGPGQDGDLGRAEDEPGPAAEDEPAPDGPDNRVGGYDGAVHVGRTFVLDLGARALLQVEGPDRTVVAVGSVDGRPAADTAMSMGFQVDPSEVVLGPRRHA